MELYLLKRMHHEGQGIYGVYESEEKAMEQLPLLKNRFPYVPASEYFTIQISLNESIEIESYDEDKTILKCGF